MSTVAIFVTFLGKSRIKDTHSNRRSHSWDNPAYNTSHPHQTVMMIDYSM